MKKFVKTLVLAILIVSCAENNRISNAEVVRETAPSHILNILDGNSDGNLNPYEALDRLLQLQKEYGADLSVEKMDSIAKTYKSENEEEMLDMFNEMDKNNDGKVQKEELEDMEDDFFAELLEEVDTDNDEAITLSELENFDFDSEALATEEEIDERIDDIFKDYSDGNILLKDVEDEMLGRYTEWDENRDGKVSKAEARNYMIADNIPIEFEVKDTIAYMRGVITSAIPSKVLQLIFEHPEVTTIEMTIVPGSIADDANMRACHYVYDHGITTRLNSRSAVASGGTDFFLAGKKRIVENGATLGVHSWGGGGVPATEVPKDDPVHKKYIELYEKTGVPASFYWYTLEAAPAEGIHIMTEEEIEKYNVRTN